MDHHRHRLAVTVALLLSALPVLADQGAPVYQANGTRPTVGGTCTGERVQIEFDTGKIWCCGAVTAGQWGLCGIAKEANSLNLTVDPADCTGNNFARGITTTGAATCSQPAFANLSGKVTAAQAFDDEVLPAGSMAISGGSGGDPSFTSTVRYEGGNSTLITSGPLMIRSPIANATTTMYDSPEVQFAGSYWTGTLAVDAGFSVFFDVTSTAGAGALVFKSGGTVRASIATDGTFSATTYLGDGSNLTGVPKQPAPSTALGGCGTSQRGYMQIKEGSGTPDQMYVCLRNSDGTWGWAMFGLAVK